ncbi:MAG: hypothetical protein PVSMB7_28110 [Chloroflexota bacterium]
MAELMTTGTWIVHPAKEDAFKEAWLTFALWASSMPGAGTLQLGRDTADAQRFVSTGVWMDEASVRTWKSLPEFRERMARLLQYVDDFTPREIEIVATAVQGSSHDRAHVIGGVQ